MTEPENFLARWSRRKQEAEREPQAEQTPAAEPAPAEESEAEQKFDPASLPALDTIGPGTDIRDFLRKGVPAELTQAALRRAWSADPTIRDFVGLSENAWDFNAPEAIPGFGPLPSGEDVHKIMAQLLGDKSPPAPAGDQVCAAADVEALPSREPAGDKEAPQNLTLAQSSEPPSDVDTATEAGAAQNEPDGGTANIGRPRRQHGGALPE